MNDNLLNDIKELFEINTSTEYEFKSLYGLTFVFKRSIIFIKDNVSSIEIKPLGIIYKDMDDYYLAQLDVIENIDEIVKEYVKTL